MALFAIPAVYYFALIVGAATYPGYSHVTNYASELGAAGAPYPALFNVSIILAGAAAILAALTMSRGLHNAGAAPEVDPGSGRLVHVGRRDGDGWNVSDA